MQRKFKIAVDLCRRAVDLEFYNGEHYANLARVYIAAGQRRKALEAIEAGLKVAPDHEAIMKVRGLLGVRAVVAQSFERIHRSNLVGMGVLPLQFEEGTNARTLKLDGTETFDIAGLTSLRPQQKVKLTIHRANGQAQDVPVTLRIDTPIEVEYYQNGGILPFVLRQLMSGKNSGLRTEGQDRPTESSVLSPQS